MCQYSSVVLFFQSFFLDDDGGVDVVFFVETVPDLSGPLGKATFVVEFPCFCRTKLFGFDQPLFFMSVATNCRGVMTVMLIMGGAIGIRSS